MTSETRRESEDATRTVRGPRLVGRGLLLVGAPLLLAIVLWFHPSAGHEPFATLSPVVDTWFLVHALLLPLFGVLGIGLYVLLSDYHGTVATIGRIGVAVYLVCYLAFEAIAGIATAVLIRESSGLAADQREGVETVVDIVLSDPVDGVAGVLAFVGTVGNLVAVLAIAVLLRRSGAPLVPVVLLAGLPIGLVAHGSTPGATISISAFCLGVAWIEFEWRLSESQQFSKRLA
ncbi:hypothetical protein C479_06462 [Halovivax asiaticus JCM 14624]|uniref:DUF4386 family protein n=1 Tax=Halovivax asiaticus JCM 14624 TaxID=1227490 RepID=M0BLB2_9EURY|nr:hypothetical protein [Halovivax asiaticus]ELZ11676.1 hypothetical protein C479_06462 [Halovivax asiaticus JCM 14624]